MWGPSGNEPAAREWARKKKKAGESFLARFWLHEEQRLADVWNDSVVDRSLRPNMVIAAALEWSPLSKTQRAAIVASAKAELLTPLGLRTLAPGDAAYQPHYAGSQDERDAAYHQGTVWPWLVGFYVEAALRAGSANDKALASDPNFASNVERVKRRAETDGRVAKVFASMDVEPLLAKLAAACKAGSAACTPSTVAAITRAWTSSWPGMLRTTSVAGDLLINATPL